MPNAVQARQSQRRSGVVLPLVLVAAGFVAVFFLSNYTASARVALPDEYADSDLALKGGRLKGWALGAEGLIADWYWMWSLQYIGDKVVASQAETLDLSDLRPLNPRLLYPLLDNATDLDPHFMPAYSYGASVLPAIDPALAVRLTEKGIANNPESWRLYHYLGFIYWRSRNYELAAATYEKGASINGAAPFMRQMVAAMKTEAGSRDTAREIYSQMLAEAEDQQSRSNAELRLMELDSLDERDAMNNALKQYRERTGRCPSSMSEVLPQLREVELPRGRDFSVNARGEIVDPLGVPYRVDTEKCEAVLDPSSLIPRSF